MSLPHRGDEVTEAQPGTSSAPAAVRLSLISHTNVGKTTLARTLLRRDIGEVRDAAHVTEVAESHTLIKTPEGEALVLLTTHEVAADALRTKLSEVGVPNLWVPKIIRRVEKIPMLGTGKTDLKRCRELALEAVK